MKNERGWFEKRKYLPSIGRRVAPKHRVASLKGWKHQKHGYPRIPKTRIIKRFQRQKKASRIADLRITAKRTYPITNRKMVHRWWKDPAKFDLKGIDTYIRRQERVIKRKKVKKEIIKKVIKRKVREIKKEPVLKKKLAKKKEIKRIVEKEYKPIIKEIRERGEHLKHTKLHKKQVNYIKNTAKCSYIEAHGLLQRCHRKGIPYDLINWDNLQGRDLSYQDRLIRLDKQIGRTYVGRTEYGDPADIRSQEQIFYEQQEEYMRELGVTPSRR